MSSSDSVIPTSSNYEVGKNVTVRTKTLFTSHHFTSLHRTLLFLFFTKSYLKYKYILVPSFLRSPKKIEWHLRGEAFGWHIHAHGINIITI